MKADLVSHMGSDLTVVNAARVSFDKESEYEIVSDDIGEGLYRQWYELKQSDAKLISYLAKHNHWTPFSHPQITIRETVPIFVARQRFKHVVGFTYNEVSRRYVDDNPEFFYPTWRYRPDGSVKQGSGEDVGLLRQGTLDKIYDSLVRQCEYAYNEILALEVAPEQARMVLPQSMYTSYYVTGSLAAWARAYKQRIDPHAQKEIQDLAVQWGELIAPLFPVSWKALTE